jgi:tetratricopeptide (TPR) repeat protein
VTPEAYDLYLKAKNALRFPSDSTGILADSLIQRSLEIDEEYSPSWVVLSEATLLRGIYHHHLTKDEAVTIGLNAANKAINLDSSNINGYLELSNWQWHNHNGSASVETLDKLLSSNPNLSNVLEYASWAFHRMGKSEEAIRYAYRAKELNPKSFWIYFRIAFLELYHENYEKALTAIEKGVEIRELQIGQRSWGYDVMAWIKYNMGDKKNAYEILEKEPDVYWRNYTKIIFYTKEGRIAEVEKFIIDLLETPSDKLEENSIDLNHDLGLIYCILGDKDAAFEYLNKGFEELLIRSDGLWIYPEFKVLHDDPRWFQLLDRMGNKLNFDFIKYSE